MVLGTATAGKNNQSFDLGTATDHGVPVQHPLLGTATADEIPKTIKRGPERQ